MKVLFSDTELRALLQREEGEGIPRIFAEMEESSLKPPEFFVEDREFRVTLWNEPLPRHEVPPPTWREERLQRLRDHFRTQRVLTNADYQAMCGITQYVAARELRRLVDERCLRRVGERRGAHYLPGPVLTGKEEK